MKDSFIVRYSIELWLKSKGVGGPLGAFLTFVLSRAIGEMLDRGIIQIDLSLDALKMALQDKEWKEDAKKLWDKAISKAHTEEEKQAIRKAYLDALNDYVDFPNRRMSN